MFVRSIASHVHAVPLVAPELYHEGVEFFLKLQNATLLGRLLHFIRRDEAVATLVQFLEDLVNVILRRKEQTEVSRPNQHTPNPQPAWADTLLVAMIMGHTSVSSFAMWIVAATNSL